MKSPSHAGGQFWYGLNFAHLPILLYHAAREAAPFGWGNNSQQQAAVAAAELEFLRTFNYALADSATHPDERVTSRIVPGSVKIVDKEESPSQ
jgi:hypothetical protein